MADIVVTLRGAYWRKGLSDGDNILLLCLLLDHECAKITEG
jgi:hypothetical protein